MSGKFCVFFLLHNTYYLTVKRTVVAVCQIVVRFAICASQGSGTMRMNI